MIHLEVAYFLVLHQCNELLLLEFKLQNFRGHEILYADTLGPGILFAVCIGLQNVLLEYEIPFAPVCFIIYDTFSGEWKLWRIFHFSSAIILFKVILSVDTLNRYYLNRYWFADSAYQPQNFYNVPYVDTNESLHVWSSAAMVKACTKD